jgi:phenylpyruvate tautomerase PptA (4-oxalocrotonate tautomerase family)
MPLAKIHVVEGRYDDDRIAKVSGAVQAALMNTLRVPPEDFYQLIFEFPKKRFLHTPSFVGMHYTDDLIILDLTFLEGDAARTLERRQHPRRRGGPRVAGRFDDHALRSPRREFLLRPG